MKQCLLAVVLLALAAPAIAEDKAPSPQDFFKDEVGTWDAALTIWPEGPDGQSFESTGSETNVMLGSWLVSDFKADFGGEQFTGRGQFTYNAEKKKFIGTWIDSMSPHLSTMEGTFDAKTGEATMIATGISAQTGQEEKSKQVSKQIDQDTRLFTMYMLPEGEKGPAVKMMEIKYTRKE